MKSFHLSTEANLDIEEIANYIFDLNPVAAYRFLDDLDDTFDVLADFPFIGRLRPDLGADVRSYPVGNYWFFTCRQPSGLKLIV